MQKLISAASSYKPQNKNRAQDKTGSVNDDAKFNAKSQDLYAGKMLKCNADIYVNFLE